MDDLIRKLEEATGPSRELDAEIWEKLGLVNEAHCRDWCRMDGRTDLTRERYITAWAPEFTKSLDAVMPLVTPPGHRLFTWKVRGRVTGSYAIYEAEITVPSREFQGISKTSALALVIAALKSLSASPDKG